MSEYDGSRFEDDTAARLRAARRAVALAESGEVALVLAFYRRRRGRWATDEVDPVLVDRGIAAEVGTILRVTDQRAGELIEIGLALDSDLPAVRHAFDAGDIDLERVRVIVDAVANLGAAVTNALDQRLVDYARHRPPEYVRRTARRWIAELASGRLSAAPSGAVTSAERRAL